VRSAIEASIATDSTGNWPTALSCESITGVGAVEDRVGDVGHLGARRARRADHRVEHLRRGDRGAGERAGERDHLLLHDRDLPDLHLDPEVAARDHHAVGGAHDLLGPLHRLRLLDLGDQRQPRVLAQERDVLGAAHERQRDEVDADLLAGAARAGGPPRAPTAGGGLAGMFRPWREATAPPISTSASISPSPARTLITRRRTAPSAR
jgi:hypothetical protein